MMTVGPVFVLKSDRLSGSDWRTFATDLGLQHRDASALLAEIGVAGYAVLCIDGIDRIKPSQRKISLTFFIRLRRTLSSPIGRSWRPQETKALKRSGRGVPFAFIAIRESAMSPLPTSTTWRRKNSPKQNLPCVGYCLAPPPSEKSPGGPSSPQSLPTASRAPRYLGNIAPGAESELIAAWWRAGGHDSEEDTAFLRQRALLDLARAGASSLGKSIAVRRARFRDDYPDCRLASRSYRSLGR